MMELLAGGREDDKVRRRTSRKIQPSDKVTSAKGDALTSKQEEIPNKQESQDDHHLSEDLSQMWLAASILGPKMGYLLSCLSFFFIACFVCLLRQMVRYDDCTDNK